MRVSPTTKYLLQAFIPFTDANVRLSFKPSSFFYELEKKGRVKERSLRSAYYRAQQNGLLEIDQDGIPRLTAKGRAAAKVYTSSKLPKATRLLVIFDIPESERSKRDHLRSLLRELSFVKIQQSVWASKYDHREYIAAEIAEYDLEKYVAVYEAARLTIET